ncbi:hypothetical protein OH77DRAFT_1525948 [Trametes cingulata]|nr:hypothetical protein OH77DRAFT_1525948 [Trametes cingulata]
MHDPEADLPADPPEAPGTDIASEAIRRKFETLVSALIKSKEGGRWKVDSAGSQLDHLHNVARLAMRFHGPYLVASQAVAIGLTICASSSSEDACRRSASCANGTNVIFRRCRVLTESSYSSVPLRERYIKLGKWLPERVPFLPEMLPLLEGDQGALNLNSTFIDHHARQGRSADISTLKEHMSKWIPVVKIQDPDNEGETRTYSPLTAEGTWDTNRANWGWNSAWSARLLVWRSAVNDFDRDPAEKFLEAVHAGDINMDHAGFENFLYDNSKLIREDPKYFRDGLFDGASLITGYRCIWTSPDSSTKAPGVRGTGRASISRMNGINQATPKNIAYVACLMRHVLSSESSWIHQDPEVFDGARFFDNIVMLFEFKKLAEPVLRLFDQ